MGYTLEITATRSLGCVSATAMAARSPAPPPPTTSTSHVDRSIKADRRGGHWDGQRGRRKVVQEPEPGTLFPPRDRTGYFVKAGGVCAGRRDPVNAILAFPGGRGAARYITQGGTSTLTPRRAPPTIRP